MSRMWKPHSDIPTNASGYIPKLIHQIWIGPRLPPILGKYCSTFKNMKGYRYKLWRTKDLHEANFPHTWKYIEKLLQAPKIIYAMIADLMRIEILYHHGGIYVDTSFEAVKNLDVILDHTKAKFIMSNELSCGLKCRGGDKKALYISNSFIVSTPGYIVLSRLISNEYLSMIDFTTNANYATGPYYVRSGILSYKEIKILPTTMIYPYNYGEKNHNDDFFDECFSLERKDGFRKYGYFNNTYFLKFPCKAYPNAIMIKNFEIGGTWKK